MIRVMGCLVLALICAAAGAGKADVLNVKVSCNDERVCRFAVTVQHADRGWQHYADRWDIVAPDGTVLATRELAHPHDHEQPFTRSLGNVAIPPEVHEVTVRARDSKHAYGGREQRVAIGD